MKKLLIFSAMLVAAATGCKKDVVNENNEQQNGEAGGITTITATSPDPGTRIALGGTNFNEVTWMSGDAIYVVPVLTAGGLDAAHYKMFSLTSAPGTRTGTFQTTGLGLTPGTSYVAYHTRSSANISFGPNYVVYTLPSQSQGASNNFLQAANSLLLYAPSVTVASGVAPTFTFQHTMSMIEFSISAPPPATPSNITSVTVSAGGAYFTNKFDITDHGVVPDGAAGSTSFSATLNITGTNPLSTTPFIARMITAWNPTATPSGNLLITVTGDMGNSLSITKAAKVLQPGVIYRTAFATVVINGVTWAMSNVDAPSTFAAAPEASGMFYQWNRKTGWSSTDLTTSSPAGATWDSSNATGSAWDAANDPCPAGWHVPTDAQLATLLDASKVSYAWTTLNGVNGTKFTDLGSGNSIFLPAAGYRNSADGTFGSVGSTGSYWSGTSATSGNARWGSTSISSVTQSYISCSYGFTVRCVFQ